MTYTMVPSCPTARCSVNVDFICAQFDARPRILLLEEGTALKSGAPLATRILKGQTCGPALPPSEAEQSVPCH